MGRCDSSQFTCAIFIRPDLRTRAYLSGEAARVLDIKENSSVYMKRADIN